jgi:hypothetical protein
MYDRIRRRNPETMICDTSIYISRELPRRKFGESMYQMMIEYPHGPHPKGFIVDHPG